MQDIYANLSAIRENAAMAGDYIAWLENELKQARQDLDRALGGRAGMATGLTTKIREILARGAITRKDLERQLHEAGVPFRPRSLGVTLATRFQFTPDPHRRRGGTWGLRMEDAA